MRATTADIRQRALHAGVKLGEPMQALGTPMEWHQSVVDYLRNLVDGQLDGSVQTSVAAIRIILASADTIEQAGNPPCGPGAA